MLSKIYSSLIANPLKKDILIYSSAKNIVSSGIITLFVDPVFALIYYFLNFPLAAYFILLCGFAIFLSIITLKYVGSLAVSRELFISAIFLLLSWLSYSTGALNSPAIFWLVLPPFLATKFGGVKSGFFWGLMSLVVITILYQLEIRHHAFPISPISDNQLLHFISTAGLVLILLFLGYFFEISKREVTYELERAKDKSVFLFEKAQESARIKNEFLANLSHEFRTPLNIIQGSAELLGTLPEEKQQLLNYIVRSTHDLTQMVDNMLDISQVDFCNMIINPEFINLYDLIFETKKLHHNDIHERNLTCTIQVDPTVKRVFLDPVRLRQVLSLYISNAIKFTLTNGHIIIRAFPYHDQLKIEVEDTGIGISKENLKKLFMPFQQVDSSITKKYKGTGIGLALVRRIVEKQGGQVGAQSTIGKGSTFWVILPMKNTAI